MVDASSGFVRLPSVVIGGKQDGGEACEYEVVIIVPGAPLYRDAFEGPEFIGRSTASIRNTIRDGHKLPVTADGEVVGHAGVMDFVTVEGEASLLFRASLQQPVSNFLRNRRGDLVGSIPSTLWLGGIYPRAIGVYRLSGGQR